MSKTNEDIEQFIYDALAPLLAKDVRTEDVISGDLYPEDCRPLDSKLEDAVIAVGEGFPDQIQTGRARINIYVADIDCGFGRKVKTRNGARRLQLSTRRYCGSSKHLTTSSIGDLHETPLLLPTRT